MAGRAACNVGIASSISLWFSFSVVIKYLPDFFINKIALSSPAIKTVNVASSKICNPYITVAVHFTRNRYDVLHYHSCTLVFFY
uniref:Uncharacterized protein n=1 Tax=Rhipicephalus appendiculatus TaxID=34631 RepID=A0A131YBR4_RHIAP